MKLGEKIANGLVVSQVFCTFGAKQLTEKVNAISFDI